jgi:hypothetical protein
VECWQNLQHFNNLREINMMTRIKVEIKQNWQQKPYSGQLQNADHLSDMGAALSDFEDAVMEKAKAESCAGILNNADMELMSEEYNSRTGSTGSCGTGTDIQEYR